jgi:hypothetical protein
MMQNIASQILSETPSEQPTSVTSPTESSDQNPETKSQNPQSTEFDERFGVLAKMERKLKERESQWKSKETEWGDKEKKLAEYEEFMKLFEENPLEALKKKKGWGVQEFNEFAVKHSDDDDLDPVAKLTKDFQSQLDNLRAKLTEEFEGKIKAKEEEITNKDLERQVLEFKGGIKAFLAENKDSYEFIHAEEGGMDAVYDLIVQDVIKQRESGVEEKDLKIMEVKTAAEMVESFLDKQYSKYLSLNKVKSKLIPNENEGLSNILKQSAPKTLDSSFSPKSKSVSELSNEERKQNAIDLVRSWKK